MSTPNLARVVSNGVLDGYPADSLEINLRAVDRLRRRIKARLAELAEAEVELNLAAAKLATELAKLAPQC